MMNTKLTTHKDFAAFKAKLTAGVAYEKKEDPNIANTIEAMATGLDEFKTTQANTVSELRSEIDRLQTKLARPGALSGTGGRTAQASSDRVQLIDEKTGKPALTIKAGDDVHDLYQRHTGVSDGDTDVSMSDFVRGVSGMKTRSELVRKSLSAGTDAAGGFTLPNVVFRDLLSGLTAESTVLQAGGMIVPLGTDTDGAKTYSYAAINALPTAAWRNELGNVSESQPTFRQVVITPRSLAFFFKISRELLMDAGNVDATLRLAVSQAFAKELDRAALIGTGTAPEPRGLANVVGVQAVGNGANGASLATLRYGNIFSGAQAILQADGAMPTAAIMSHRSRIGLGQLADTTNQPLQVPPMLSAMKFLSTSQISNTQTVGTSTDCTSMFLGEFKWMGYGLRENVNIQPMKETFATTGEIGFFCHARVDVMCLYPQSFSVVTGIRP
jgi:HK97 family phage major capsid protein